MNVLVYQLTAPVARGPYADVRAWLSHLDECPFRGHVERALWGGFHADRLGYAFVAGYGAALSRLYDVGRSAAMTSSAPALRALEARPFARRVSLCATEIGGGHPRAIATRLDKRGGELVLSGEKTFATMAPLAEELLVVATRGVEADGRSRLRVVRVRPTARGVSITPRPETPFAPEVPHAVLRLDDVVIDDDAVLPGDGYTQWLKPFRTLEDTHVVAATVGYLLGAARAHGFSRALQADLTSLSLALIDVGARDPSAPLTHILVAGLLGQTRRLVEAIAPEWDRGDAEERARFTRDLPLLTMAEVIRAKRTEAAFERLG